MGAQDKLQKDYTYTWHQRPYSANKQIKDLDYIVKDGSHMMPLTRADVISEILQEILEE
jgi:hypothetical protein